MSTSNQYTHYQLPTPTYTAGGSFTQPLQNLPQQLFGRWAHLTALLFRATMTPTFSAGSIGAVGTNNVVTRCDVFDGQILRFSGGFAALRVKEKLQTGGNRLADSDQGATTVLRTLTRVMHFGPPQAEGFPSDFAIPTGMLKSGEIRFTFGSTSDVAGPDAATVSAVTGSVAVTAKLILLDEIRIPPLYQFQTQAFGAADFIIAGRGLYHEIGLYPASTFSAALTAFAAGDLASITLDMGYGYVVPGIDAKDLNISFNDDFARGDLVSNRGEPQGSTDTNEKNKNPATATALSTIPAEVQPVLWMPPDGRLSKCYWAENQVRLRWSGSKTSGQACYGRSLSQPPNLVAQNIARALQGTSASMKGAPSVRTLSKATYKGPLTEFMPWKVKVG